MVLRSLWSLPPRGLGPKLSELKSSAAAAMNHSSPKYSPERVVEIVVIAETVAIGGTVVNVVSAGIVVIVGTVVSVVSAGIVVIVARTAERAGAPSVGNARKRHLVRKRPGCGHVGPTVKRSLRHSPLSSVHWPRKSFAVAFLGCVKRLTG